MVHWCMARSARRRSSPGMPVCVVFAGGIHRPRNVFAIPAFADDDENVVHFARHQPTLPGVPTETCTACHW